MTRNRYRRHHDAGSYWTGSLLAVMILAELGLFAGCIGRWVGVW